MNKDCEKVLKYIIDNFNSGHNPTFSEISEHFDFQYQDLKVIIDYLIENEYYIIFDEENTKVNWNKYNGVPSIKGRDYFKTNKETKIKNFFKYVLVNIAIPTFIAVISSLVATNIQCNQCCQSSNQTDNNTIQNIP